MRPTWSEEAPKVDLGKPLVDAVVLPYWFDRPPGEALDIAKATEELGFEALWVGEMATFDAFSLAGAIAATTRRIKLHVGPLALGVRSPAALALGIGSVSEIGGRPAQLALGASSPQIVSSWHGRDWSRLPNRLQETIEALRPMLAGERGDYSGELVNTSGFRLRIAHPSQHIAVAAFGPRMLERAGQCGDRLLLNLMTPDQIAAAAVRFEQVVRDADRQRAPVGAWVCAALDPDKRAIAQLSSQIAIYLAPPGYGEMFSELGFSDLVDAARDGKPLQDLTREIPLELLEAVALLGSEDAIRTGIERYRAAGVDHLAIVPVTAHDPAGRRLLTTLSRGSRPESL